MEDIYNKLKTEVIDQGLCTHCGTCVGLSQGQLKMKEIENGPFPESINNNIKLDKLLYESCPGKGLNYPELARNIFGKNVLDWRIGFYKNIYIGYSFDKKIRSNAASGGILTNLLIYLLETGKIDGAVLSKQGTPKPWLSKPIIARTKEEIISCSQSIYSPVPVNTIIDQIINFSGKLAFIGLPDHISSIRYLQKNKIGWARKIKYLFGPYVGTNLYPGAINSFLKSNGYNSIEEIKELKYRDGEWPGYLKIKMNDGTILQSGKFYYNYLIPFFVTRSSLLSVDFCNELTDISVGDAWHPKYEKLGGGYSVIIARSKIGYNLLMEMKEQRIIQLRKIDIQEAINMHGHMIDFKKRGSFIRFNFRKIFGKRIPNFGYIPQKISLMRILAELVISTLFFICGLKPIRNLIVFIPIKILGPFFNYLRIIWKTFSKGIKRKGLNNYKILLK